MPSDESLYFWVYFSRDKHIIVFMEFQILLSNLTNPTLLFLYWELLRYG